VRRAIAIATSFLAACAGIIGIDDRSLDPTLDGGADGAANRFTIAAGAVYLFELQIVAKRTDIAGHVKAWTSKGTIYNNAGTTALVGATTDVVISDSGEAWTIAVTANTTTDALEITFTGGAGETIRVVASARMTKVSS